jgi:hypothetical protein
MRFLGSGGFISAAALHGINVLPLFTGARSLSTGARSLSMRACSRHRWALLDTGAYSLHRLPLSTGLSIRGLFDERIIDKCSRRC